MASAYALQALGPAASQTAQLNVIAHLQFELELLRRQLERQVCLVRARRTVRFGGRAPPRLLPPSGLGCAAGARRARLRPLNLVRLLARPVLCRQGVAPLAGLGLLQAAPATYPAALEATAPPHQAGTGEPTRRRRARSRKVQRPATTR